MDKRKDILNSGSHTQKKINKRKDLLAKKFVPWVENKKRKNVEKAKKLFNKVRKMKEGKKKVKKYSSRVDESGKLDSQMFQNVNGNLLLKPEYKQVISDVIKETVREIENSKNHANVVEDVEGYLSQKIKILKENIDNIVKVLKLGNNVKEQYIKKCPEWLERNDQTVVSLKSISDILKKRRKRCNISRMVGYSASLVGGAFCVLSAALAPVTMGLTLPFVIAGGSMIVLGTTDAIGTSITEAVLLKKQLKATKTILDGTPTIGEELSEFLSHSFQISEAIKNIMSIKFFKDIIDEVGASVIKAAEIHESKLRKMLVASIALPIITSLPEGAACCINVTATLVGLILVFIFLRHSNKLVTDCGILVSKAALLALTFTNSVIDMGVAVANIVTANVARKVGVLIARGSVALISMILDITNLVLHAIEVRKGSVSKEAKRIGELAQLLEKEGELIKEVREILMKEKGSQIFDESSNESQSCKKSKMPPSVKYKKEKKKKTEPLKSLSLFDKL